MKCVRDSVSFVVRTKLTADMTSRQCVVVGGGGSSKQSVVLLSSSIRDKQTWALTDWLDGSFTQGKKAS